MNHFDGSPGGINEYDGQYGTGKPIKPGDVLKGWSGSSFCHRLREGIE